MNPTNESLVSIATATAGPATSPRLVRSRTHSISSDRGSLAGHGFLSPPPSTSPEAGFIAASAASQIITNDHDAHAAIWYDQHGIEPSGETALISSAALHLVNNFLDQLLFNILSKARSTSLSALRPAVAEVLKPKLAKDAIHQADEELHEYLGGGDEDELLQQGVTSPQDWDLELVWKRTRLRCMVYSSLGDLEEEDEDYYMDQEGFELDENDEPFDVISPAVAIFLTSILEFMGEQALVVAGQGAYNRLQSRLEKEIENGNRDPTTVADRVIVDEVDMDRVALDRTLGRLWRAWKKRVRSPTMDSRPYSRGSARGSHYRQTSAVPSELPLPETTMLNPDDCEVDEKVAEPLSDEQMTASSIPLPVGERDVDEIEVPGLVSYTDDENDDDEDDEDIIPNRPHSMLMTLPSASSRPAPSALLHKRSNSVPSLALGIFSLRGPWPALAEDGDASEAPESETLAEKGLEVEASEAAPELDAASQEVREMDAAVQPEETTSDGQAEVHEDDIEHFEILTSARVSISGSNSPSIPDSEGNHSRSSSRQAARPTSLSSPRLIEVAGPKSPVTRSPSTPQAPNEGFPLRAVDEDNERPQAVETIFRSPISSPVAWSPVDRLGLQRPVKRHVSSAISEVEEDPDALSVRAESTPTSGHVSLGGQGSQLKQTHVISGYPSRRHGPPSPIQEHVYTGTKVTIIADSDSHDEYGPAPPVPPPRDVRNRSYPLHAQDRASRQMAATAGTTSIGKVTVERSEAKQDSNDFAHVAPSSIPSRQIHTSGSSVSSGTSRLKPVRTSEDSGNTRPGDVARNFEDLIHSDQTIQYTLTPESMRDIDTSSLSNSKSRKSDDVKRINAERSRSSSGNSGSAKRVGSHSVEVKRSHSISRQNTSSMHSLSPDKATFPGPITRAPRNSVTQGKRAPVQVRDAQVHGDSIGDFADFIRNTGPASMGGNNASSPLRNGAPASTASAQNSINTRRVSAGGYRPRLQARDPTIDNKEDHSDLIDFIRRGPSDVPGSHRIPRAVAPFRTTMDSDQLTAAVGGRAVDATIPNLRDSQASASATDMSPSMHSSINSSSALLKKKPSYQMGGTFDEDGPMPKRKTRRVKDPYAIDFSDEEEEEIYAQASKPVAKQEESLAEFLMNSEPPPETAPVAPIQTAPVRAKKKSSTSNLLGRFRSSNRSAPAAAPAPTPAAVVPRTSSSSGRGYIPIQVNFPPGYDKYGPIDRPTPPKTSSSAGAVPRKKYEPRDSVISSSRSGTADLAAFLLNSEPPSSGPVRPSLPPTIEEHPGSVSRMLGRRKKSMAA
ncbi:uncharacterized protein DNG_01273 [Cephalotrichum gorgonifer]|uniref:Flo11 n=1 Tax=Cephalotrichum gorgonifer TaxID=2041049 RepID=A0AAE8MRG0_9PEZI|nr:uncharacterized protein DNG_01273 [Cephalotrichum gorgonifer]